MWPKLIAQLVELLPHVSRLVPLADRYFASRTANDKTNEAMLAAMAETVKGDLGQVTAAHSGLYRKLQEQSARIDNLAIEVGEIRTAVVAQEYLLAVVKKQTRLNLLLLILVLILLGALLVTVMMLLHLLHHPA